MAQYALLVTEGSSYAAGIFGIPVHAFCILANTIKILAQALYYGVDMIFTLNPTYLVIYPLRKFVLYVPLSTLGMVL